MGKGLSFIFTACLLTACAGDSLEQSYVQVDSHPDICMGVGQQMCLRVKHDDAQQWQWHYDGIVGFDYVWGYSYTLLYSESEVEQPLADGPDIKWVLLDVVTQVEDEVGALYEFTGVSLTDATITHSQGEYTLLGYPFTCARGLDCDTLLMLNGSNRLADLEFRYLGDARVELTSWQ